MRGINQVLSSCKVQLKHVPLLRVVEANMIGGDGLDPAQYIMHSHPTSSIHNLGRRIASI